MRTAQYDNVDFLLQQRRNISFKQEACFVTGQIPRFDLFNQTGTGLAHDLDIASVPRKQLYKVIANQGPAGSQNADNPGLRVSRRRLDCGLHRDNRYRES